MGILEQIRSLARTQVRAPNWRTLSELPEGLTRDQVDAFDAQGYIVVDNLFSPDEIAAVRDRLFDLIHGRAPIPPGVQFEREVATSSDASTSAPYRQIWDIVPAEPLVSRTITFNPKLISPLKSLLGPDIKLYRVTAMLKQAAIGSDLPYHQDSAYWPIEPMDLVSCWVAIDDATRENGCMRVLPGMHRQGLLDYSVTERDGVTYRQMALSEAELAREIALEMSAGSCLFFHSLLPHATGPNHSDKNRFALISSYMSARSKSAPRQDGVRYLSVCGQSFATCV